MRGIVLNDLRKFQLVELLLSRSENIKKPENDAIEELAEESLMKNKVLKQRTSPTKSVRDRRKGDLIKEILAIEVRAFRQSCLSKMCAGAWIVWRRFAKDTTSVACIRTLGQSLSVVS